MGKHQGIAVAPLHESTIHATPRRVSFGVMMDIHQVLHRHDYTREELAASWFDLNEMKRMREIARYEGRMIDAGLLTTGDETSTRGLEHRTRPGLKRKRESRLNAFAAVFLEIDLLQHE